MLRYKCTKVDIYWKSLYKGIHVSYLYDKIYSNILVYFSGSFGNITDKYKTVFLAGIVYYLIAAVDRSRSLEFQESLK